MNQVLQTINTLQDPKLRELAKRRFAYHHAGRILYFD